jgi:hypothetical protein
MLAVSLFIELVVKWKKEKKPVNKRGNFRPSEPANLVPGQDVGGIALQIDNEANVKAEEEPKLGCFKAILVGAM